MQGNRSDHEAGVGPFGTPVFENHGGQNFNWNTNLDLRSSNASNESMNHQLNNAMASQTSTQRVSLDGHQQLFATNEQNPTVLTNSAIPRTTNFPIVPGSSNSLLNGPNASATQQQLIMDLFQCPRTHLLAGPFNSATIGCTTAQV